jgi:hypothetical protein
MVFLFSYCDESSAAGLPDGSRNFAQIQTDFFFIYVILFAVKVLKSMQNRRVFPNMHPTSDYFQLIRQTFGKNFRMNKVRSFLSNFNILRAFGIYENQHFVPVWTNIQFIAPHF